MAGADLYNGPVYIGPDGDVCTMWDDGAEPFSFRAACEAIREALSGVSDVYLEEWSGSILESEPEGYEDELTGEWLDPGVCYLISASDIITRIVGRELAAYVS